MSGAYHSRICVIPVLSGVGGMVSFREKLVRGMTARGIELVDDLRDWPYQAVLVIGGTRHVPALWRARRRGVRIVQRLDGINWIHRRIRTGWKHFSRAEYGNYLLAFIRSKLATHVVYQSEFVKQWWERDFGATNGNSDVIYNGVDLEIFKPSGEPRTQEATIRILLVEGSLLGGYEVGLESGVKLVSELARRRAISHSHPDVETIELMVVGKVSPAIREHWEIYLREQKTQLSVCLNWRGVVPHEDIPSIDRMANLFYSSDLNAACPNSVIEALASGTPVIGFDTGAIREMLAGRGGKTAPYGGDPWKLEPPDIPALAGMALEVLADPDRYRTGARDRAEEVFDVNHMVTRYLEVLMPDG